jgi:histidinol phosphatase-like PHP family hydrolase
LTIPASTSNTIYSYISLLSLYAQLFISVLEVNTGHNYNKEKIVHAAARWGAKLVVNSDAHLPASVGQLDEGAALLKRLDFPPEQVINAVEGY